MTSTPIDTQLRDIAGALRHEAAIANPHQVDRLTAMATDLDVLAHRVQELGQTIRTVTADIRGTLTEIHEARR